MRNVRYYGKQGYIAHFERQLDEDGLLDKFKTAFEQHTLPCPGTAGANE